MDLLQDFLTGELVRLVGREIAPLDANHDRGRVVHATGHERPLRIAMLGTRGVPPRYGGFETAVDEIGRRLGLQVTWQAVGYDARGRKQYRYHPAFRAKQEGAKFDKLSEFAKALPRIRRRVKADLASLGVSPADVAGLFAPAGAEQADIQTIAVVPRARRRGLGRTLIDRRNAHLAHVRTYPVNRM